MNSSVLVKLLKSHFLDCPVCEAPRVEEKSYFRCVSTSELTKQISFLGEILTELRMSPGLISVYIVSGFIKCRAGNSFECEVCVCIVAFTFICKLMPVYDRELFIMYIF